MLNDMHGRNFIPVAEEYIRKGLLDQAIDLLKEGVEIYPGYLSARVSLGKAYLEKEEAKLGGFKDEFLTESMGDICIAQGEKAKGIEIFKKILQKDPDNETVRGKLTALGEDIFPPLEKQAARLGDFLSKVRTNRR